MNKKDNRRHPRFDSINLSYICLDKSENIVQQAMARTINISESGLLIETHFKMEKDYKLIATIGLRDETADIKGKVVYAQPTNDGKYMAGIEITENEDEMNWKDFIKKISETAFDDTPEK